MKGTCQTVTIKNYCILYFKILILTQCIYHLRYNIYNHPTSRIIRLYSAALFLKTKYKLNEEIYLFNLKDDPNEHDNLATVYPDLVEDLKARLAEYEATMIPPDTTSEIVDGNPANFGGVWSTGWCDSEPA